MNQLSSKYLFHFKNDASRIKSILENGYFIYNHWKESLPYKTDSSQENFIVCFTDMLLSQSKDHTECYGENGLVFKKDWGEAKNISPVRYIHKGAVGIQEDYLQSRNKFLIKNNSLNGKWDIDSFLGLFSKNDAQILIHESSKEDFNNFLIEILNEHIFLRNELAHRDALMRAYKETFTCPATGKEIIGKILYDEREWRSLYFWKPTDSEDLIKNWNEKKIQEWEKNPQGDKPKNAYYISPLDTDHRLEFSADDLVCIIADKNDILVENDKKVNAKKYFEDCVAALNYKIPIYTKEEFIEAFEKPKNVTD